MIITSVYFFCLGLIVGSFLNVVILRYNTGRSLAGRSGCFSCRHKLAWYELLPVVSFVIQKGRCRHCGSKMSRQYPLVELLTGVLFALTIWKFYPDFISIIFYCLILSLLVVIVVYDLRHKIIPDTPIYLLIMLSVLAPLIGSPEFSAADAGILLLRGLIAGFVMFTAFFCLWYFSRGRWMGFGDAKLAFVMGVLLGFVGSLNAIILAFWLGAVVGLLLIAITKMRQFHLLRQRFSIKSEVPFAPFLAAGLLLNLFWSIPIFAL